VAGGVAGVVLAAPKVVAPDVVAEPGVFFDFCLLTALPAFFVVVGFLAGAVVVLEPEAAGVAAGLAAGCGVGFEPAVFCGCANAATENEHSAAAIRSFFIFFSLLDSV
jgi:hypothetical protein